MLEKVENYLFLGLLSTTITCRLCTRFLQKNCFGYCLRKKLSNLRVLTRNEWGIVQHVREHGQAQAGPAPPRQPPYHVHSFPAQFYQCLELDIILLISGGSTV